MAISSIILLLIIPFYLVSASSQNRIEIVHYANQKKTLYTLNKEEKIPYYIPKEDYFSVPLSPIILKNKFGTLTLYDLSKESTYLNAISYEKLSIEGNLSAFQIGLADKQYALKEDHLKLKNRNQFQLNTLNQKLDLTQLKYLVFRSSSNKVPLIKSIKFKRRYLEEQPIFLKNPLETWVWQHKNIEPEIIKKHHLKRLYIQMENDINQTLENISNNNITIYGLNGAPNSIYHISHLLSDIHTLSKLKKIFPYIVGYQIDVEPYLLPLYQKDSSQIWEAYFSMLKTLQKEAKKYHLKLSVVIPFWFDQLYFKNKNIGLQIIDLVDEVVLMSYRSHLDTVIDISSTLLYYASMQNKEIRIGIELMKIEDEKHEIYKVKNVNETCLINQQVIHPCTLLTPLKTYTVKGKDISFFGQLKNLENITSYPLYFPTFKGFVLHHYETLPLHPFK